MKFDLQTKPPPIVVRVGAEELSLHHRFLTAVERAAAIDSLNRGLAPAMVEWWSYILSWAGVTDLEGAPIAMIHIRPDGSEDRKNFDLVIGRLPFIEQLKVFLVQIAMNGVQIRRLHSVIADLVDDKDEVERLMKEIDPFLKSGKEPPGSVSKP